MPLITIGYSPLFKVTTVCLYKNSERLSTRMAVISTASKDSEIEITLDEYNFLYELDQIEFRKFFE